MLRLPLNASVDIVSGQIDSLRDPGSSTLQVPSKIPPAVGFTVTGVLIQFLALWSRHHEDCALKVVGSPSADVMVRLAEQPHGSVAIYFANRIIGNSGFRLTRNKARQFLIPVIHAMQSHNYRATSGSRGVHLCCFNGSINEYIGPLYSRNDELSLRERTDFVYLMRNIIAAFEPTMLRRMSASTLEFIGSVVYELFSNTHHHARSDEEGNIYPNGNVRGIVARTVEYRQDTTNSHINTHLSRYMAMATAVKKRHVVDPEINKARFVLAQTGRSEAGSKKTMSRSATRFLELTVYDTGPGLARQWALKKHAKTSEQFDFVEELKFINACFEIGNTTKTIKGVGEGLGASVRALKNMGAFLTLRTGRAFLYQDFLKNNVEIFSPSHWYTESHEQEYLPGTSYTIVIPIGGELK